MRACVSVGVRESACVDIEESGRVCACKRSACVSVHDSQIETVTALCTT